MEYRREIDGLRAVAVLPVILCHAGVTLFSGGYVGVDVFFVISGYLITNILLGELDRDKFSIISFYERRARRILPALFFVMVACLPFAWVWMQPLQFKDFSQSLIGVSLFASNFLFWMEAGYFDAASHQKPLVHTWSLAVEEQYYLLFPILLFLMWRYSRNHMQLVLWVMILASFALCQWGATHAKTANYFLAPFRMWELLAGSACALTMFGKPQQSKEWLSALGLLMICVSIVAFDSTTPFPSVYAILPVLGTALIILFADAETWTGRLLSLKFFVGIGLVSFSAYLWHQPMFAFAHIRTLDGPPAVLMLSLAALSIVMAWVSWRFVETPFRVNRKLFNRRVIFMGSAIGLGAFTALGFAGHVNQGFTQTSAFRAGPDDMPSDYFQKLDFMARSKVGVDGKLCYSETLSYCRKSKLIDEPVKFVMAGDSHSGDFTDQFNRFVRKNRYVGYQMSIGGCGFIPAHAGRANGDCPEAPSTLIKLVKEQGITDVIYVSNFTLHTWEMEPAERQATRDAVAQMFRAVMATGARLYVFTPRPWFSKPPTDVFLLGGLPDFAPEDTREDELAWLTLLSELEQEGLKIYDQRNALLKMSCGEMACFKGHTKDQYPMYRDTHHVTKMISDELFTEFRVQFELDKAVDAEASFSTPSPSS